MEFYYERQIGFGFWGSVGSMFGKINGVRPHWITQTVPGTGGMR
jgi:hypothetical protein